MSGNKSIGKTDKAVDTIRNLTTNINKHGQTKETPLSYHSNGSKAVLKICISHAVP